MKLPKTDGYLHWVLPAMLALAAAGVLISGRDLSQTFIELADGSGGIRGPIIVWGQRLVSVLLLLAAGERIAHHVGEHRHLPSAMLTFAFVAYWVTTVAMTAVFGSHPQLAHEYLYALVLGFAMLLATPPEWERILDRARDALVVFIIVGVALIPVMPSMVLDMLYSQGLIPGLPRFGGLAPHPVAMGMFAQTALLLIWARPYARKWVNVLAWLTGLSALFLAQSKTAWIAFFLCSAAMWIVRDGGRAWARITDPRGGSLGVVVCLAAMTIVGAVLGLLLASDWGTKLSDFADSAEGAQLMSMTGRDRIWAIAMEEWQSNYLFGYGPGLWDDSFRLSIGMPNATDAHNQFMDTLARSGTVGFVGLVFYGLVLMFLAIRHARSTGGLSLALFVALALRSVSEVPLLLFGYGTELYVHFLLLVTLAAGSAQRVVADVPRARFVYGATS